MASPGPGERIGPYELREQLGRGGMGVVHRAVDARTGQEVALKLLLAVADERARRRQLLEARALTRLRHPSVVSLLDAGEDRGRPWLALELVRGRSLQERLDREGALAPADAARLVQGLAAALAHAHGEGVLHRDLKPANVLLPDDGGPPKLTDFGLAGFTFDLSQSRLTRSGTLQGSPGYWSPEQVSGQPDAIGPATDVYGLGAVLYAALTRRPPIEGESLPEVLSATTRLRPEPPGADPALDAIALRCLEKDPGDRYPSVAALERELLRYLAGPGPRRRRGPLVVAAGLVTAAALAGGGAVALGRLLAPGAVQAPRQTTPLEPEDRTPPAVRVLAPAEGAEVGAGPVEVRAEVTDAAAWVDVALGAGSPVRVARGQTFSGQVTLEDGATEVVLVATDPAGNRSEARRGVTRAVTWTPGRPVPWSLGPARLPAGVVKGQADGEYVNERDGSVLLYVPPGTFRMGSDSGLPHEKPVHPVRLTRGYFVGKHEVTWGQLRAFCAARGLQPPTNVIDRFEAGDSHPVFNVSWDEAQAYCQWAGLRLPSEAEWEYAARGADGRSFPWGDEGPGTTRCNLRSNDYRSDLDGHLYTAPVGSYAAGASAFGALDMTGNVWEWVQDWYAGSYPSGAQTDPSGPATGTLRAYRGVSWYQDSSFCRAAYRSRGSPGDRFNSLGFRVVRSSEDP